MQCDHKCNHHVASIPFFSLLSVRHSTVIEHKFWLVLSFQFDNRNARELDSLKGKILCKGFFSFKQTPDVLRYFLSIIVSGMNKNTSFY